MVPLDEESNISRAESIYELHSDKAELTRWRELGALDKAQNILSICRPYPHTRILDVGCGDGAVLKQIANYGFGQELHGVDISSKAIALAESKKIPSVASLEVFDGYHLPHPDKHFDLAILTHVLEHVEFPRRLIYEISRVADYVFIEVPMENTMRLGSDYLADPVGHINFYDRKTIRRFLQTCELEILEVNVQRARND